MLGGGIKTHSFFDCFICGAKKLVLPTFCRALFYLRRVKIVIHSIDSLYKDFRNNLGRKSLLNVQFH